MKELDLLKKYWNTSENTFEQLSEMDIYKMIHQRSSSVVMWILIVSILEFFVLNGLSLLLNDKDYDAFLTLHPYIEFFDILNYVVILGFIIMFYINYKSISALKSAKELIKQILKTRKVVTYYIVWNVVFGGIIGTYSGIKGFNDGYNSGKKLKVEVIDSTNYLVLILISLLVMGFIWGFYKLIYGGFLSKLSKNYEELKKIDL